MIRSIRIELSLLNKVNTYKAKPCALNFNLLPKPSMLFVKTCWMLTYCDFINYDIYCILYMKYTYYVCYLMPKQMMPHNQGLMSF